MLIERNNNEIVIKTSSDILPISELQQLLDYLRYKEISKTSKAKKSDLKELLSFVKKKRVV